MSPELRKAFDEVHHRFCGVASGLYYLAQCETRRGSEVCHPLDLVSKELQAAVEEFDQALMREYHERAGGAV